MISCSAYSYYQIIGSIPLRSSFTLMTVVLWVVAPCDLVEVYQLFRRPCCLQHQGFDHPDEGSSYNPQDTYLRVQPVSAIPSTLHNILSCQGSSAKATLSHRTVQINRMRMFNILQYSVNISTRLHQVTLCANQTICQVNQLYLQR